METKIILFCLLSLILGGCIPLTLSLHPLYTDDTVVYDEKLIGKWMGGDEIWQFSKAGEKEYELRVLMSEKEGRFEAHLLELEGNMYLDLYPDSNESLENMNELYKNASYIGSYLFEGRTDRTQSATPLGFCGRYS